jgi:hypothetical protein
MSNTDATPKRVKGSAIVSDSGDFIFTPYATHSEEEKNLKCIAIEGDCTLWKAKNHYSLRVKIPFARLPTLAKVAQMMMCCFITMKKDALHDQEKAIARAKKREAKTKNSEAKTKNGEAEGENSSN